MISKVDLRGSTQHSDHPSKSFSTLGSVVMNHGMLSITPRQKPAANKISFPPSLRPMSALKFDLIIQVIFLSDL